MNAPVNGPRTEAGRAMLDVILGMDPQDLYPPDPNDLVLAIEAEAAALAAPSTPEPSGPVICGVAGCELHPAAPSTEPALDVELLREALASFLTERGQYRGVTPEKLAAEYARLAESQP